MVGSRCGNAPSRDLGPASFETRCAGCENGCKATLFARNGIVVDVARDAGARGPAAAEEAGCGRPNRVIGMTVDEAKAQLRTRKGGFTRPFAAP